MSIIAKRVGEEFRDKIAKEVFDFLFDRYGERALLVMFENSSGSPTIRIECGGDERAHLTITRARH